VACYTELCEWVETTFEAVQYESRVELENDGRVRVHFRGLIDHGEHHLDFRCQQLLTVDEQGLIQRIEHIDLPGERDKDDGFNLACGVTRPG
jgi:hypothetical protein